MTVITRQPVLRMVLSSALAPGAKVVAALLLLVLLASADAFAGVATAAHQHGGEGLVSPDATDVVFEDIAGHASLVSDPTAVATALGTSAAAVGGAGSADRVGGSERPAAPVGRGGGLSGFAGLTPPVRVPFRRSWDVRDVRWFRFATAQLGDPVLPTLRARPRRAPATAGRGMAFRATCSGRDSPSVRIHAGAEVVREVVGDWHRTWWLSPALDAPVGYTIACEAADCSSPPALLSADDALGAGETSASFFPVQTFRRDVVALADASGSIVEAYRYDVFGTPEVVSPSAPNPWSDANALAGSAAGGAGGARSTYGNSMLWAGAHWRPELRLYHMRARQYDPSHGLFLSPDPLGYVDSFDEWLFASGDPFGGWDPFGLQMVQQRQNGYEFVSDRDFRLRLGRSRREALHAALDSCGFVPGVGEVCDGANALVYVANGEWGNAALSAAAVVPILGSMATGQRVARRAGGAAVETLPGPRTRGNPNPISERGTFYVDSNSNAIPTPPGGHITGSPDGRFIQARDAAGNPTGVRIDGPHRPATHPDPRAQQPHGHVPGVTNPDGTPWLPINQ